MKIIFLDIDGVLNHFGYIRYISEDNPFAPANVEAFNRIIEKTGASIVLSSSWWALIGPAPEHRFADIGAFGAMMTAQGVQGTLIDVTPDLLAEKMERGQEMLYR